MGGLTVIGAKSRLMLHRYWYCNTEKDVLSGLYWHDQAPQIRLIRGSGTRYVAVVVPLAKLGLTKCPAVRGASEACDRNRDFAMKPFPSQHSQDSYNQPQV